MIDVDHWTLVSEQGQIPGRYIERRDTNVSQVSLLTRHILRRLLNRMDKLSLGTVLIVFEISKLPVHIYIATYPGTVTNNNGFWIGWSDL
jgi:hypothetical protein